MVYDVALIRSSLPPSEAARLLGIALAPRGGAEWACCPLHGEKTPSFKVDRRSWHCFGCHEGGDSISLIAKVQGISYGWAIGVAATWLGISKVDHAGARRLAREAARRRAARAEEVRQRRRRTAIYNATCDRLLETEKTIDRGTAILVRSGCLDIGGSEWEEIGELWRERDRREWLAHRLAEEMRRKPTEPSSPLV